MSFFGRDEKEVNTPQPSRQATSVPSYQAPVKAPEKDIFSDFPVTDRKPNQVETPSHTAKTAPQDVVPDKNALLFSSGNTMEGTLNSSTDIIIEGEFTGPIHTDHNVHIRNGGIVKGDITANLIKVTDGQLIGNTDSDTIVVDGCMKGDIDAKCALFLSHARYRGNVKTDSLGTREGSSIRGNISVNGNDDEDVPASTEKEAKKAEPAGKKQGETPVKPVVAPVVN